VARSRLTVTATTSNTNLKQDKRKEQDRKTTKRKHAYLADLHDLEGLAFAAKPEPSGVVLQTCPFEHVEMGLRDFCDSPYKDSDPAVRALRADKDEILSL